MSPAGLLAAVGAALAAAAAWELAGSFDGQLRVIVRSFPGVGPETGRRLRKLARRLGMARRLRDSGYDSRIGVPGLLAGKLLFAGLGGVVAWLVAPLVPDRFLIAVAGGFIAAGFLVPDALLDRATRTRRRRLLAALPDALDLLAVGVSTGRSPVSLLGEIADEEGTPLATEIAKTVAELECGASPAAAFSSLRERVPGVEIAALTAVLERSARHGSPLAEQLRGQATALRSEERRRIEDQAARAAPKIQLVVALILVPSVLAMIAAALLAHSDRLLGGL